MRRFLIKKILFWLMLMTVGAVFAAEPLSSHRIVPENAKVGDVLTYTLILKTDETATPEKMPVLEEKWGDFLILSTTLNSHIEEPLTVWIYEAKIMPLKVGELWFPTLTLLVKTDQGIQTRTLDALPVSIKAVYLEGQGMKPAKPMYSLPFPWVAYSLLGVFLISVLGGLFWGLWWWLRCKKMLHLLSQQPELSAKEWAEQALLKLQNEKLRETGNHSYYYLKLTEILKVFLSKALKESLEEFTTEEVLAFVEPLLDEQLVRRIQQVMVTSDLAKFAKYIPTETEHDDMMNRIQIIIARVGS